MSRIGYSKLFHDQINVQIENYRYDRQLLVLAIKTAMIMMKKK